MQEIGIESSLLQTVLNGAKTIEVRIGKPKFLKLRVGDEISLREDVWQEGKVITSMPGMATVVITQLLYFENFEEMLGTIEFQAAVPDAESKEDALAIYRKFYSPEDEEEYGVMAITFKLKEASPLLKV